MPDTILVLFSVNLIINAFNTFKATVRNSWNRFWCVETVSTYRAEVTPSQWWTLVNLVCQWCPAPDCCNVLLEDIADENGISHKMNFAVPTNSFHVTYGELTFRVVPILNMSAVAGFEFRTCPSYTKWSFFMWKVPSLPLTSSKNDGATLRKMVPTLLDDIESLKRALCATSATTVN